MPQVYERKYILDRRFCDQTAVLDAKPDFVRTEVLTHYLPRQGRVRQITEADGRRRIVHTTAYSSAEGGGHTIRFDAHDAAGDYEALQKFQICPPVHSIRYSRTIPEADPTPDTEEWTIDFLLDDQGHPFLSRMEAKRNTDWPPLTFLPIPVHGIVQFILFSVPVHENSRYASSKLQDQHYANATLDRLERLR